MTLFFIKDEYCETAELSKEDVASIRQALRDNVYEGLYSFTETDTDLIECTLDTRRVVPVNELRAIAKQCSTKARTLAAVSALSKLCASNPTGQKSKTKR